MCSIHFWRVILDFPLTLPLLSLTYNAVSFEKEIDDNSFYEVIETLVQNLLPSNTLTVARQSLAKQLQQSLGAKGRSFSWHFIKGMSGLNKLERLFSNSHVLIQNVKAAGKINPANELSLWFHLISFKSPNLEKVSHFHLELFLKNMSGTSNKDEFFDQNIAFLHWSRIPSHI